MPKRKLTKPAKAPRVTNAQKVFAKANQNQLSMTLKSELSERGLTPVRGTTRSKHARGNSISMGGGRIYTIKCIPGFFELFRIQLGWSGKCVDDM